MKSQWFFETLFPNVRQGLKTKKIFYSGKSKFQKIKVMETVEFGKILVLDGVVQTTERDEFVYHEMITHVPIMTLDKVEEVLIIGGGDGGVLREVLKHPVKKVYMVEIDKKVIDVSKKYLPKISDGAFDNKKTELVVDDGAVFLKKYRNKFDVIIVDSSDPIGPAEILFRKEFYQDTYNALTNSGIMVRQTGSTFFQLAEQLEAKKRAGEVFPYNKFYVAGIPTYIGGFFSLFMCGKKPLKIDDGKISRIYKQRKLKTLYYNPSIHEACFALPNYMEELKR